MHHEFCFCLKDGNDFGNNYYDLALINIPLIKVTVMPVLGTNNLKYSPKLDQLEELVYKCFMKILTVVQEIPRVEQVLFPGNFIC